MESLQASLTYVRAMTVELPISVNMSMPGPPQNVRPSSYRGSDFLKIRWQPPSTNAQFVTHYKAQYKKANDPKDPWHTFKRTGKTKLSAVAKDLRPDTDYYFRVQSVNKDIKEQCPDFKNEEYSEIIMMDTRWSRAAKVAVTPGAVVGGALASPFVGASIAATGVWKAIKPKNPVSKALTGLLSVGAGVFGGAAGIIAAPVGGVAAAVALHKKGYQSPQSTDDDDDDD